MQDHLLKSFGYGVYQVSAESLTKAVSVSGQVGRVLEAWSDPEDPKLHVVVLDSGHETSKYEAAVLSDPEVRSSAVRAVLSSPAGSAARSTMRRVLEASRGLTGEGPDASAVEP